MKLSPVQMEESYPLKMMAEYNNSYSEPDHEEDSEQEVTFEHMTHIAHAPKDQPDGPRRYYFSVVGLRSAEEDAKSLPYTYEIIMSGLFSIDVTNLSPDTNVDDMAAKHSFTMLYGQIRELLTGMTCRMRHGAFTLPTMNFLDAIFPVRKDIT
jgi:hypothetical protein